MNELLTHLASRFLRIGLSSQTTKRWAGASQCRPPGQIKNRPREAAATPAATPRIKGQAHRSTLPAVRPTEGGYLGTRERKTVHGHLTPTGSPTRTHGAPQLGLPSPAPTALEETPAQPFTARTHATHSPEAPTFARLAPERRPPGRGLRHEAPAAPASRHPQPQPTHTPAEPTCSQAAPHVHMNIELTLVLQQRHQEKL